MGLKTIFSYIYWHSLEPVQGQWNFTGINDIAAWYQEIQNAGLYAAFGPGPYVCGERDWGGFPAWLSQISGMTVRANNEPFLTATQSYIEAIASQLQTAQITHGGSLLMV
jgi:beta-galactosidase GanA